MEQQERKARWIARRRGIIIPRLMAFVFLVVGTSAAFAAKFTASLDRDTILVGESVTLTLSFEGISPGGMPRLPAMPGLQVGGSISSSLNSSQGADGQMHSVQSYSVPLIARVAGDFQIPALQIELGGQKLATAPLQLKVLAEDPVAPPPSLATNPAFLWLALPKTEAYVGEVLVAELRLYLRGEIGNISNVQIPPVTGDGYNAGKLVQGAQFQRTVGNASFTVIPLAVALTPVKSGRLTIGPLNGSVMLHWGQRDIFGRYRQQTDARLATEPQTLRVLPLPQSEIPTGFAGAVGVYTMTVSAGPTNVAAGDPITVRVQITGRGALEALTLPAQDNWENFKFYPPNATLELTDKLGVQGIKTFEQIVSPESVGVRELPPLEFSFFDPEAKQFRTLVQPAVPLTVRPGGAMVVPVVAANQKPADQPPPAQDIVHIKPRPGALAQTAPPLIQQPWFLAAQSVPVLAWLLAVGWRRRAEALANNPRLRRRRQVAQIIRAGFADLRRHASENDSDAFFATLFRLLQEQLGERLDCPASAITEAVIEEKLHPRGLPEAAQAELHELFQTCNLARYAPIKSGEKLAALIPRFEAIVRELQNIRG